MTEEEPDDEKGSHQTIDECMPVVMIGGRIFVGKTFLFDTISMPHVLKEFCSQDGATHEQIDREIRLARTVTEMANT